MEPSAISLQISNPSPSLFEFEFEFELKRTRGYRRANRNRIALSEALSFHALVHAMQYDYTHNAVSIFSLAAAFEITSR